MQPLLERVKSRGKIVAGMRRSCVRALIVVLFSINTAQLFGFGAAGPFAHSNMTRFAIERFSQDQGIAVDPTCAELIIQGNIENDVDFTDQDIYHCDNNNLVGCSRLLGELKHRASGESNRFSSLETMGNALHIVQDFYAHSNWVEKAKVSMALAPLESYANIPPLPDVQSGLFPDVIAIALSQDAALACFLTPPEAWEEFIPAATHGCLNKDSNLTMRGSRVLWYSAGMTLHELAAEYAIRHSVKVLEYYYEHNPHFMLCTAPDVLGGLAGCARSVGRASERNLF